MKLIWRTPDDFRFTTAVCSHGFFALAPNQWDPETRTLTTTVWANEVALTVRIRAVAAGAALQIDVPGLRTMSPGPRRALRAAVRRILRLDESLADFQARCAAGPDAGLAVAGEVRFGRLLRSASLFEDVVKTLCTCNITWRQTLTMVDRLVQRYGAEAVNDGRHRAFPGADRLAAVDPQRLRTDVGLGYRADWVQGLAADVAEGRLDLNALEDPNRPADDLYQRLRRIKGVGDYAASTLCILLGRYDRLAVDSVLMDHYRRRYPRRRATPKLSARHYARYAPYQALVYWWELWQRHADAGGYPDGWT
ncbi:MAG: hypothetical protein IID40_12480 [Planctomycetes bacterium]|nr:hypothetical protein [Planctomycetota bacterium]